MAISVKRGSVLRGRLKGGSPIPHNVFPPTHTHTHTHMHTHTHTHPHPHLHTHTPTHTNSCVLSFQHTICSNTAIPFHRNNLMLHNVYFTPRQVCNTTSYLPFLVNMGNCMLGADVYNIHDWIQNSYLLDTHKLTSFVATLSCLLLRATQRGLFP